MFLLQENRQNFQIEGRNSIGNASTRACDFCCFNSSPVLGGVTCRLKICGGSRPVCFVKFNYFFMKINRLFSLIILTFFLLSFSMIKRNSVSQEICLNNKYFKLLNARSSSWTAGTARGGTGTEFYFKILIKTKQKIVFDSLWVENRSNKIFITKEQKFVSNVPGEYSKGDTITLRISFLNNNNKTVKTPKSIKGDALLSYRVNEKLKYYSIKKIETQNPIYYP